MSQTNQMTGAEALVEMLRIHGVEHIFGLCGDTTLPWYDALYRMEHGITHLLTRDERHAAYMADAYARIRNQVGVCEGPSGGGATYIAPGVVEANESSVPILALTSDVSVSSRGRYPLTELDQVGLFTPLAKHTASLDNAARLPANLRAAFRAATTGRTGAVHLGLPIDTQRSPVAQDEVWGDKRYGYFPAERPVPADESIEAAAKALLETKRAVIVCGGGPVLSGAEAALVAVAERLNLPVATSVSGQGVIAETHPLAVGVVGSNGGVAATRAVVEEADLVFFVGCRAGSVTSERWTVPLPTVRVVHLDIDAEVIGANYATEVALVGDARAGLEGLLAALNDSAVSADHDGANRARRAWQKKLADFVPLAESTETPIKPERVIATLAGVLNKDAIICADPGTPCPYFSAHYRMPSTGRRFITNRAHGALGFSLGASIGAQVAEPNTQVVAVMGDGSFAMAVGELETLVRYGLPVTVVVFSNATFGWIRAGQRHGFSERFYNVDFSRSDCAAIAQAFGLDAWRVEDANELEGALRSAVASDKPALVDIVSQPLDLAQAPVSEWIA